VPYKTSRSRGNGEINCATLNLRIRVSPCHLNPASLTGYRACLCPVLSGRIHVRNPVVLGQDILHKYFRHSKYSSFQRQLNYFGFRKTQGKV
jgi:hypothetical protein